MAKYNGSVELISGITQKNGQDFPLVDASAVQVDESGKRLDEALKDNFNQVINNSEQTSSISDKVKQNNLVEMINSSCNSSDGEVTCRCEAFGITDKAGTVVNGVLGDDVGRQIFHISKPMHLEAEKTYTIRIDTSQRKYQAGSIFFYEANGSVMKEDGMNKGFSLNATNFSSFVPDATGEYMAGIYCRGYEFVDFDLHVYVLEGKITSRDFYAMADYASLRGTLSRAAFVSDYARDNNLVQMRTMTSTNAAGEEMVKVHAGSGLDPALAVITGDMGPEYTVARLSEVFIPEEGEIYTIFVDDCGGGRNYSIMISDAFGSYLRNDDVIKSFNPLFNPYGQFIAPEAKEYHIRLQSTVENHFDNYPLCVYVLKGVVPLEKIRSFAKYREGMDVVSLTEKYGASMIRIKDEIRKKNILPTKRNVRYDAQGNLLVKCDAGSDVDSTIAVFDGCVGSGYSSSTFTFTDYFDFKAGTEYTVVALDLKCTLDYAIYFYGKNGGVMQQGGVNYGRYVLANPIWYITPDEDGEYRAGVYCGHDTEFTDHPLRFMMLEGHYTMRDIREGFTLDEYEESVAGVALVQPEITRNNRLITKRGIAVDDEGNIIFTAEKTGEADRAGIVLNGTLGPEVQRNNVIITDSFQIKGGQAYTFYVDSDKSLNLNLWVADAANGASIQTETGPAPAFTTATKPYGVFVPAGNMTVYIRVQFPYDMTVKDFRMHLYVVEGEIEKADFPALVTPTILEERASAIEAGLNEEADRTAADAIGFNAHGIYAQQVSDDARRQNLAKVVSMRRQVADNIHTCMAYGRFDPAGGIMNGLLTSENSMSTLHVTDYIEFEAGEKYTVFTDVADKSVSISLFFYEKGTGAVLKENEKNRGFNIRTEPFGWFVPDTSGLFRGGFYSPNAQVDNVEFHVYVLKGEHTRDEFLGLASGPQIADSVTSMTKVKDWVRKANLATCSNRGTMNSAQDNLATVLPVGPHDRAGGVIDGTMGANAGIPNLRYSEPFEVEAGKSYTVLITDEDPDANYKVMFTLDPLASAVRQNGSVRYLDVRTEPCGIFIPDVSGPVRVNVYTQAEQVFDHHVFHVYVLEGVYSKNQLMATAEAGDGIDYESFGLPVLKLTGSLAGVTKEVSGTFDYVYGDLSGTCTMKWQGASSLSYPKKNFTIKFNQKFEAKEGWGERKKYVLKANYVDFSHARNIVCARLWGQVVKSRHTRNERLYDLSNGGAIDGFPIIMLLNGEYYGLYTFNLPKDEDLFGIGESTTDPETGEVTLLNQAVFCADNHTAATQFKAHCVVDETDFSYKYVPNEEDFQWAKDSLDNLIDACLAAESEADVDALADKVDLDSALDYLIFTVLLAGSDMTDKNYIISTYDGVQWFFTAYDMDSVFGNHWTGKYYNSPNMNPTIKSYASGHQLMKLFRTYKRADIKARYAELRAGAMSEQNVALAFENFMVDIPRAILNKEVERWPLIGGGGGAGGYSYLVE